MTRAQLCPLVQLFSVTFHTPPPPSPFPSSASVCACPSTSSLLFLLSGMGLWLAALQGGEHLADIGQAPLHGDAVIPVELFFAGLDVG